jgi:purine nucleoside phosphorylase
MRVGGVACVTNMAAGLSDHTLSHEGVLASGAMIVSHLQALLMGALPRLATYPAASD